MRRRGVTRNLILALLVILSIIIQSAYMLLPNQGIIIVERLENTSYVNVRVVLIALISLIGIVVVCINYRVGKIIAYIIYANALITMCITMHLGRSISSITGIVAIITSIACNRIVSTNLERREHETLYDCVTGDPNLNGLSKEMERLGYDKMTYFVIVVHIRNLNVINDNMGFMYGDKTVIEVSKRLKGLMNGRGLVGKLDTDDFIVVVDYTEYIRDVADSVLACFTLPIDVDFEGENTKVYMHACAGVAKAPDDSGDLNELVRYADIAMFAADKVVEDRIMFFSCELLQELNHRIAVESKLKESLKNEYLYIVYQPQYAARSKAIRGFEALVRMRYPDGSSISPGEFVPIAEKSGLVSQIDEYVMKHAMKEFKAMIDATGVKAILAINISSHNFASSSFVGKVEKLLAELSFPPECLELEITEYSMYVSTEQTRVNMNELRKRGVKIAMDDFGTGFSSLAQVISLPFDSIKIDKSLIDKIVDDEVSKDFVKLVIYMGHLINTKVISEGVESEEQITTLVENKCDYIQGYVWSKPVPYEMALELLETSSKVY